MLKNYLKCKLRMMWGMITMCIILLISVYNLAAIGAVPMSRFDYVTMLRDSVPNDTKPPREFLPQRTLQNTDKDVLPVDIPVDMYRHSLGDVDNNFYLDDDVDARPGIKSQDKLTTASALPSNVTKKLPDAIIIGVKKGGTRALLEFLRLHPRVMATGPEPHFFDRNYHQGLDWYRSQMPHTMPGQLTIEKTPSYFVTKEVPKRIYDMSKDTKLLVVVRDPVVRAISDYTQTASKKPNMKSFERMALLDHNTGLVNTSWGAVRIGVYPKHLDRWLKHFPLKQFHFVSGERLIEDPASEIAKVQEFLGLEKLVTAKNFYFGPDRAFPCIFKNEQRKKPHCLGKTKGRQHPDVDPYVIQRLRDFYKPFNMKFYQMVGQNFRWPS